MDCKRVQRQLGDYRTGRLSAEEHAFIDQHLRGCETCTMALKDEETVSSFLRQTGEIAPEISVTSELMLRLKQKDREVRHSTGRYSLLIRVIVIVLIILVFITIGVLVMKFSEEETTFYPSYGPVGFTYIGGPDDEQNELWKTLPGKSSDTRSGHQIQIPVNQPESDASESEDRVIHTFELGPDSAVPEQTPGRDTEGRQL